MRSLTTASFLFLLTASLLFGQQKYPGLSSLRGPFLGQKPPGLTPELFAPGIVSTRNTEWTISFTPDGNEGCYTIQGLNGYNHLVTIRCINGVWQKPQLASFSNPDQNADPYISPDGKKLFFWSNGPENEGQEPGDNSDIWYVERKNNAWGKPCRLDSLINTEQWQIFPTVASNGNLYFSSNYPDSKGGFDIYMSHYENETYTAPVNLGDSINTKGLEQEPFIAPDESYLIFCSDRHSQRVNSWDLFISFRKNDGTWTRAMYMGDNINSQAMDQAPIVTSDGRFLFFSSKRTRDYDPGSKDFSLETVNDALENPRNGNSDIYWVDAGIIEALREKAMKK